MKSKQQVMEELGLDTLPDDEFMELYDFASSHTGELAQEGPHSEYIAGPAMTPSEISETLENELVARNVGQLLRLARQESGLSQSAVADEAGVGRSWINQAERKEYLELPSLVRLAEALGYRVKISLEPTKSGRKPLRVELGTGPIDR